jgi:hypothetical protein
MNYLDSYTAKIDKNSTDKNPLYQLILENRVVKYLKDKGYKYVHIGSNYYPTKKGTNADVNYIFEESMANDEFMEKFLETTLVHPLLKLFFQNYDPQFRKVHHKLITNQVNYLKEYSKIEGPKFVFAHLFLTHTPFVFDQYGNYQTDYEEKQKDLPELRKNMYTYANALYKDIVNTILSNSKNDPIIIIQADEGPYFERLYAQHYYLEMQKATADELKEKSMILNAYHLPFYKDKNLYPSISPVNTFRLIFNLYFNDSFQMLEDKTYAHYSFQKPYSFLDVTDKVK